MAYFMRDDEKHRELAFMAMIACDDLDSAREYLKVEHGIVATPKNMLYTQKKHHDQYEELRQRIAPIKEQTLAHDMLDNALYAAQVTEIAMEQLRQRLGEGRVPPEYLSRVVRDLADVQAKSVDKRLALEGRPTTITETRNAAEIIRALESKGVLKPSIEGEVKEITDGRGQDAA